METGRISVFRVSRVLKRFDWGFRVLNWIAGNLYRSKQDAYNGAWRVRARKCGNIASFARIFAYICKIFVADF